MLKSGIFHSYLLLTTVTTVVTITINSALSAKPCSKGL